MSQKPFLKSRFFKLPQYKTFDFAARYYDENKNDPDKIIRETKTEDYSLRIKNSFNSKKNLKTWNQNWETIRLLIIFSVLILGFAFIYSQIDSVLEALTKSSFK